MRARSFFYVCAGLFLLAAAYAMGTRSVQADVKPDEPVLFAFSSIAYQSEYYPFAIRSDGAIWERFPDEGEAGTWFRPDIGGGRLLESPVPTSEVIYFNYPYLVSTGGHVWRFGSKDGTLQWLDFGFVPDGTVGVEKRPLSQFKQLYR